MQIVRLLGIQFSSCICEVTEYIEAADVAYQALVSHTRRVHYSLHPILCCH